MDIINFLIINSFKPSRDLTLGNCLTYFPVAVKRHMTKPMYKRKHLVGTFSFRKLDHHYHVREHGSRPGIGAVAKNLYLIYKRKRDWTWCGVLKHSSSNKAMSRNPS